MQAAGDNSKVHVRERCRSNGDLYMETQSGWAADTNLSARLKSHETFVDMNPANENYYISYFQLNIRLTLYLQHLQFSNMTAGIFRL